MAEAQPCQAVEGATPFVAPGHQRRRSFRRRELAASLVCRNFCSCFGRKLGSKRLRPASSSNRIKAGPYSRKLYDELELLENLNFIESEVQGEATEPEAAEIEELSFDQLLGDDAGAFCDVPSRGEASTADSFEERRFRLTQKGAEAVQRLLTNPEIKPFVDGIRRIKSKFADYSLQDLLYHVYTKYEADGWTSESEIRDKVLRKGTLE